MGKTVNPVNPKIYDDAVCSVMMEYLRQLGQRPDISRIQREEGKWFLSQSFDRKKVLATIELVQKRGVPIYWKTWSRIKPDDSGYLLALIYDKTAIASMNTSIPARRRKL